MTATFAARADLLARPAVVVPESFRLSDENPMTGQPYSTSLTFELPLYVLDAIEETLGIVAPKWNELVRRGEVHTVAGPRQRFSLARFLRTVRSRPATLPASFPQRLCGDCWGTCATHDYDGSVTGSTRGVYLCTCSSPDMERASWR